MIQASKTNGAPVGTPLVLSDILFDASTWKHDWFFNNFVIVTSISCDKNLNIEPQIHDNYTPSTYSRN